MAAACAVVGKDKIRVPGHILPAALEQGMAWCKLRLPGVKEGEHGPCRRRVHIVQQRMVERRAGLKALFCALRLALFVCAQHVAGVIAEKVCRNAGRAQFMRGDAHLAGEKHLLFSAGCRLPAVDDVDQRARVIDLQLEAHAERLIPAGGGDFAFMEHFLVIHGERLQDHVTTSTFRQSRTPRSKWALKNCARISCGSA